MKTLKTVFAAEECVDQERWNSDDKEYEMKTYIKQTELLMAAVLLILIS